MPPDFLNSREDAALIWTVVVLAYLLSKSPRVLSSSFLNILWMLVKPPLLFLFAGAGIYCAGVLVLASELGLWHTTALKETVYWFIGTGVVLAGHATEATPGPAYVRKILGRALRVTILLEFIVNLYVFPLAVELVFVPVVGFFLIMDAWIQAQPNADPSLRKFTDGGLVAIGWFVLLSIALRIGLHPGHLFTRETLERLLVVPTLTITFVPFLCLVVWYSRRQVETLRRHLALG